MNEHLYAYLKQLAWSVMPGREILARADRRAHIINAVQQYPEHHRRFIANCAWSRMGYGGGI